MAFVMLVLISLVVLAGVVCLFALDLSQNYQLVGDASHVQENLDLFLRMYETAQGLLNISGSVFAAFAGFVFSRSDLLAGAWQKRLGRALCTIAFIVLAMGLYVVAGSLATERASLASIDKTTQAILERFRTFFTDLWAGLVLVIASIMQSELRK